VTHDMRLVERVAERVVFLEGGHVVLYGLPTEMEHSPEPVVRHIVELDRIDLNTVLQILSRGSKRTQGRKTA
jgi:ABC-type transporter Mla maintaining outer membrane lipid asymmetry ATPase subunit MlaF